MQLVTIRTASILGAIGWCVACHAMAGANEPPAIRYSNPDVADVPAAFRAIDTKGRKLAAWAGEEIGYPFYSVNREHDFRDNHFQGIQRLREPNYLVVSGSNIANQGDLSQYGLPGPGEWGEMREPVADLFVIELASRDREGALDSNVDPQAGKPPEKDRVVARIELGGGTGDGNYLWHAGGISVVGDILVVPNENYKDRLGPRISEIVFFDVSNPRQPRQFEHKIDRTSGNNRDKAGAAAMVRLADGRFLLVARSTTHSSFYISQTERFEDGFHNEPTAVFVERNTRAATGVRPSSLGGSTLNFVQQADGTLFLVTFEADRRANRHWAELFRLDFASGDYETMPVVTKVAEKDFGPLDGWGHFAAAAGIYVTDDGRLAVYTAGYWQVREVGEFTGQDLNRPDFFDPEDSGMVPMTEFWPE